MFLTRPPSHTLLHNAHGSLKNTTLQRYRLLGCHSASGDDANRTGPASSNSIELRTLLRVNGFQGTQEVGGLYVARAFAGATEPRSKERHGPTLGSQDTGYEHRTRGARMSRGSRGLRLLSSTCKEHV